MSIKKLIAALLCSIILTGCADTPANNTYNGTSTTTAATTAVTPATTTTAATTKATTTARTTAATTEKYTLSTPQITSVDTSNIEYGMGAFVFISESDPSVYKSNADIVYDIYVSEYEGGTKYILSEGVSGDFHIVSGLQQGYTYYLYVMGYDRENNVKSAISAPYTLYIEQPKPQVHYYMHTFKTPYGVTVLPDYDSANSLLASGVQATEFEYKLLYTCPYCGKTSEFMRWDTLPYTTDGSRSITVHCMKDSSCPGSRAANKVYDVIYSYASQLY